MGILFLNFADPGSLGEQSVAALQKKYPLETIHLLNLLDSALLFKQKRIFPLTALSTELLHHTYSQVIIGAHGARDNTDWCYCRSDSLNPSLEELFNPFDLAVFIDGFLALLKERVVASNLHFLLAICYGARTEQVNCNHVENYRDLDFSRSFAGKFFKYINNLLTDNSQEYQLAALPPASFREVLVSKRITLEAFTGSVGFNCRTGEVEVETEENVLMHTRIQELQEQLVKVKTELRLVREEYIRQHGQEALEAYEMREDILTDSSKLAHLLQTQDQIEGELVELEGNPRRPFYGRVLYLGYGREYKIDFSGLNIPIIDVEQAVEARHESTYPEKQRCCTILGR